MFLTATLSEILAICQTWEPENILGGVYRGGDTLLDAYIKTQGCAGMHEDNSPDCGNTPKLEDRKRTFFELRENGQRENTDRRFEELMELMLRGRVFATTSQGYIGAFPGRAQIGDHVCVALGFCTPFLLRPVSGREKHYRLVGSCYVAGLMNGEALLGPLPASWQFGRVNKNHIRIFVCDGEKSTLEDPRLGPLTPGWRICYYDGGKEKNDDGNLNNFYFRNKESGDETWYDPKLDIPNLFERGLNFQEFVLV